MNNQKVTCSFSLDRELYNQYKSIVVRQGYNVKGDLVRHMISVIKSGIPNEETIKAMEETEKLLKDPNAKAYNSFRELLEDIEDE